MCLLFTTGIGWAKVIYLKTDGSDINSGTSWADAFATIQKAIDSASDDDQIWVMEGTYSLTAQIYINNTVVHLFGGFPDDIADPRWGDRNWGINETIVDGQNGVRCVFIDDNVPDRITIDGFIIRNGNASDNGGGVYGYFSGATIANCTFYSNSAENGGGIYTFQSSFTITNCTFIDNTAAYGGAVTINDGGGIISDCDFLGNTADDWGGAVDLGEAGVQVINCLFEANNAESGGAISNSPLGWISISQCSFLNNTATRGGAIFNQDTWPVINRCQFFDNTAQNGGAIYNSGYGGADTEPVITNCIFSNNYASEEGGGMYNDTDVLPEILSCTFYGNLADQVGGAISNHDCNPIVTNSILWGNSASSADEIYNLNDTTIPVVIYCDVEGGYVGAGNIDSDPLFINTDSDDFHLQSSSLCINTGTSAGAPVDDFDGDLRPQGLGYDIGADEFVFIKDRGGGGGN